MPRRVYLPRGLRDHRDAAGDRAGQHPRRQGRDFDLALFDLTLCIRHEVGPDGIHVIAQFVLIGARSIGQLDQSFLLVIEVVILGTADVGLG